MKLRSVDLFCGVGGLTYGTRSAGIEVIAGYDIDAKSKLAYEENNPGTRFILEDVALIQPGEISSLYPKDTDVRILMGCAPCQPFSTYNRQPRNSPARSSKMELLSYFGIHIKDVIPEIISMENVPNLAKEPVFGQFVDLLAELGYCIDWKVVNAAHYGVPQSRKRLLLLASRLGQISLLPPTHGKGNFVTVRDRIGRLPKLEAGETHLTDNLHRSRSLTELNLKRIRASKPGGTWEDWPKKLLPEAYLKPSGQSFKSVYGRLQWDQLSSTITTQFIGYGSGRFGHPSQDRALSLREGALLQTFPEEYIFVPKDTGSEYHVQPIATQIGNAVPPRLGEVIGESIKAHLNI